MTLMSIDSACLIYWSAYGRRVSDQKPKMSQKNESGLFFSLIGLVSEMTYTVSSGTLNPSIPYHTTHRPSLCVLYSFSEFGVHFT